MEGDPPDLPKDTFSEEAHDFVRGCLNKIPKLRLTYAMLLRHPWLGQLLKPPTITEEEEDEEEGTEERDVHSGAATDVEVFDKEVATWVKQQIEKRRSGTMVKKAKPALHAAPLDATQSPG